MRDSIERVTKKGLPEQIIEQIVKMIKEGSRFVTAICF